MKLDQETNSAPKTGELALRFVGVGNAQATALGNSACVIEQDHNPILLIDCGRGTLDAYRQTYGNRLPSALYITHGHMDHICGLEELFYRAYFHESYRGRIKLFVPAHLVVLLQNRLANYPSILAEGGANFWDAFHLIPVGDHFWHATLRFTIFPVRHHEYLSAFGLALSGNFLYTGDTRPIPEIIRTFAPGQEWIFHDCALVPNPSHTGLADLFENYQPSELKRMICYHYESEEAANAIRARGLQIAEAGIRYPLPNPIQHKGK